MPVAPVAELAYAWGLGPHPARVTGSTPVGRTLQKKASQMEKLSKGLRKYIREEKARIRREFLSTREQEENLKTLYETIKGWYKKESAESI